MSTQVTIAVAKPNHLPIMVYIENKVGAQWVPGESANLKVGEVETFLVHGTRRIVVEECKG